MSTLTPIHAKSRGLGSSILFNPADRLGRSSRWERQASTLLHLRDRLASVLGSCGPGPTIFDAVFTQLFGDLLAFVYRCFDRIATYGYLSGLSWLERVVYFFRQVRRRSGGRQRKPEPVHCQLPKQAYAR
jgi:hypothetical protein